MDINSAVSRNNGVADEKLLAISDYKTSAHYDEPERVALEYADRITITGEDVDDELFARIQAHYSPQEIVELTFVIGYENFLSKFSRPLRIDAQGFCPVTIPIPTDP